MTDLIIKSQQPATTQPRVTKQVPKGSQPLQLSTKKVFDGGPSQNAIEKIDVPPTAAFGKALQPSTKEDKPNKKLDDVLRSQSNKLVSEVADFTKSYSSSTSEATYKVETNRDASLDNNRKVSFGEAVVGGDQMQPLSSASRSSISTSSVPAQDSMQKAKDQLTLLLREHTSNTVLSKALMRIHAKDDLSKNYRLNLYNKEIDLALKKSGIRPDSNLKNVIMANLDQIEKVAKNQKSLIDQRTNMIKRFRSCKEKNRGKAPYLYHVTPVANLGTIKKRGLDPKYSGKNGRCDLGDQIQRVGKWKRSAQGFMHATASVENSLGYVSLFEDNRRPSGSNDDIGRIPIPLRFHGYREDGWQSDFYDRDAIKTRSRIEPDRIEALTIEGWIPISDMEGLKDFESNIQFGIFQKLNQLIDLGAKKDNETINLVNEWVTDLIKTNNDLTAFNQIQSMLLTLSLLEGEITAAQGYYGKAYQVLSDRFKTHAFDLVINKGAVDALSALEESTHIQQDVQSRTLSLAKDTYTNLINYIELKNSANQIPILDLMMGDEKL